MSTPASHRLPGFPSHPSTLAEGVRAAAIATVLALFAAGCSMEWNSAAAAFPLVGDPPPLESFEKLNANPAGLASPMEGPDGVPWTAFCEFWAARAPGAGGGGGGRTCKRVHLVRLGSGAARATTGETIDADDFALTSQTLFIGRNDAQTHTRTLVLHRPGDPGSMDASFTMAIGRGLIYVDENDDVFAYFVVDKATTHYDVFRRDGRYHRTLPLPAGVDPTAPQKTMEFVLTADGDTLVVRDPQGQMTAYSTLDESAVALGTRPPFFFLDPDRPAVITAGDDGLNSVPLAGGPGRALAPPGFGDPATLVVVDGVAWYSGGGDLFRLPLDGSAPPERVQVGAARLLDVGPGGEVVYSRDAGNRYVGGAGDGWIGSWNFMERGRLVRWSDDGRRIRFLEHAAQVGTVGDLISVPAPSAPDAGGPAVTLGLNVHAFAEVPDGRVLAIENHAQIGAWNRLVAIDEATRTKTWVVPSATEFFVTPEGNEVIADVVSGASGYDILRVPFP